MLNFQKHSKNTAKNLKVIKIAKKTYKYALTFLILIFSSLIRELNKLLKLYFL